MSRYFRLIGGTRSLNEVATGVECLAGRKNVPDSGQAHLANNDDGFLWLRRNIMRRYR